MGWIEATTLYVVVMAANALWFGAAFRFFSLQHRTAAKLLVPYQARGTASFESMAAIVRFLGGMNAALFLLSVAAAAAALFETSMFASTQERAVLLGVLGFAHITQFWFNVPVLQVRRAGGVGLWPVMAGPMRRIFLVDLCLGSVGLGAAAIAITQR